MTHISRQRGYDNSPEWLASPVRAKLVTWLSDFQAVSNARLFLLRSNSLTSLAQLPGYYAFVRRCLYHMRNEGYAAAVASVQADVNQWIAWGFIGPVLRSLALLQGVVV